MQSAFGEFVDLNHRRTAAGSTDRLRQAGGQDKPTTPERASVMRQKARDFPPSRRASLVSLGQSRLLPVPDGVQGKPERRLLLRVGQAFAKLLEVDGEQLSTGDTRKTLDRS
jgi:hypothetical protein